MGRGQIRPHCVEWVCVRSGALRRGPSLKPVCGLALGLWAGAVPALAQEAGGGQVFRFGFEQRFSVNDNQRLDPISAGTTTSSDTRLSFGYLTETRTQRFEFNLDGVARLVDDPVNGNQSDLSDAGAELRYTRANANSRFELFATYDRTDLSFADPLAVETLDNQDVFSGGGEREDVRAGLNLETGMQAPLGFVLNLEARERTYSGTTDPLLFDNETYSGSTGARFQISPVLRARLDVSASRYSAEDAVQTRTDTDTITAGLGYQLATGMLDIDIGRSEVDQTFDAVPGTRNVTRGTVGTIAYTQGLPDGQLTASLDTAVTQRGRQTTLEFGRVFTFPTSQLDISVGATRGDTFDARAIGRLAFTADMPRGSFNVGLTRSVAISDIVSQATETTRADLGYRMDVNPISSLSLAVYYTDISAIGPAPAGTDRQRGSLTATYSREIARDWEFQVGYEHRYFNPQGGNSASSNQIFFALQREFEFLR